MRFNQRAAEAFRRWFCNPKASLPGYADFIFSADIVESEVATRIQIVKLRPNPIGDDDRNEEITLRNPTEEDIVFDGWMLKDDDQQKYDLNGIIIPSLSSLTITLDRKAMLNNSGDTVWLVDNSGNDLPPVSYTSEQAKPGNIISFD